MAVRNESLFVSQLLGFWRWVKVFFGIVVVVFALSILLQVVTFVRMAYDVHPAVGWATGIGVVAGLGLLIGAPIAAYLRTPKVVEPPNVADPDAPTARDLQSIVDYLDRVLVHAESNPALAETREKIPAARADLSQFRSRIKPMTGAEGQALDREICAWSDRVLGPIWKPIDRQVERLIYSEAVNVGVATAISPNGTLDAYLMLWRSTNLIAQIAAIHYGRPGLFGTLAVCRDVAAATAVAGSIQSVSDSLGNIAMHSIGGATGMLAGPVSEGITNALVLTRIGYLAEARCKSYRAWSPSQQRHALMTALSATKRVAFGLSTEIVRKAGVGLGAVAEAAAAGMAAMAGGAVDRVGTAAGKVADTVAGWGANAKARFFGGR
jgi:putative membrane protein